MINIEEVDQAISNLPSGAKTKDVDALIKKLKERKEEISYDLKLLRRSVWLQRAFFFVNLSFQKSPNEKFLYIDRYKSVFSNWFSTDQLIKTIAKCEASFLLPYAKKYVKSKDVFTRRWGYVMFIFHPSKKNEKYVKEILLLLHDDEERDVQMAQGWLLCELAIFHPQEIYDYLAKTPLDYKIASKAISKIYDSFRIDEEWTNKFIGLRSLYYAKMAED